ncbi:hypothetical protein F0U60_27235 [Archangium minus]|uniref:Uncharacterized protein n=1 Tax=Archangium minus TaxID=83450 RepID=A0ABY9WWB1_9BACT|nr:hypothetical protein F0U61_27485 [Archangium violaceum]WNG47405.1 hypothetical protein F0U60_27235 [Archangium minus]
MGGLTYTGLPAAKDESSGAIHPPRKKIHSRRQSQTSPRRKPEDICSDARQRLLDRRVSMIGGRMLPRDKTPATGS